ncbi:PEPKR2 [Symbiodinium natans]|uniref:PEPKR2 protein n=1 Tax=Symbiodinium natans TaxID=878477 RepID=A0A812QMI8_9DINO|nr:PEPKR2 [Symbiodinium natans]
MQLLAFVRLHAVHEESPTGVPQPIPEAGLEAVLNEGKSDVNKKYKLGVCGHFMLIFLDEAGSKRQLDKVDLIGLEIFTKTAEGSLPLLGLRSLRREEPMVVPKPAGPAPTAKAPAKGRTVSTPPSDFGWLLVAEAGEECMRRTVDLLAGAGGVRTDLENAYQMDDGVVGTGSFGVVRRAKVRLAKGEHKEKQDLVAKCIDPASMREFDGGSCGGVPTLLRSELSFMLTAKGHPNILNLHSVFRQPTSGQWVLILDYCAGGDAFTHISKTGVQPEATCKTMLEGLLLACGHLHWLDILHRDVKPENLLLQTGGRPMLADFGLACKASDSEETRKRVGSPGYIPPEVLQGGRCTAKADVFAAGATLHFAISGSAPFVGKDMAATLHKTVTEKISYDGDLYSKLSPACKKFALLLLSKTTAERPSAGEALNHEFFKGKAAAAPGGKPPTNKPAEAASSAAPAPPPSRGGKRGATHKFPVSDGAVTRRPSEGSEATMSMPLDSARPTSRRGGRPGARSRDLR